MIRLLRLTTTILLSAALLGAAGCSRVQMDPNRGAESVYLRSLDNADMFEVRYLRPARIGPLTQEKNALTVLWLLPINHPDMSAWLEDALPENADAANIRASIKTPWYGHLLFFPTLGLVRIERVRFEADPVEVRFLIPDYNQDHGIRLVETNP